MPGQRHYYSVLLQEMCLSMYPARSRTGCNGLAKPQNQLEINVSKTKDLGDVQNMAASCQPTVDNVASAYEGKILL